MRCIYIEHEGGSYYYAVAYTDRNSDVLLEEGTEYELAAENVLESARYTAKEYIRARKNEGRIARFSKKRIFQYNSMWS